MITGELKSQVDKIWDVFASGGVSNPISVIEQFTFLLFIRVRYLTINGTIDKKMLAKPPFTEIHDQGITGVFEIERAKKIIEIIDRVNQNAG